MKLVASILLTLLFSGTAAAATQEQDVERYVALFSGNASQHNSAVETLAWMGISDVRLYDLIEQKFLDGAQRGKSDSNARSLMAHYLRALGFSGQAKYASTISKYLEEDAYGRHARTAMEDLSRYQAWNPLISNRSTFDPQYSDDVNRVMNMLRSNDILLKGVGAKRIFFQHHDDVLLDLLAKELQASYQNVTPQNKDALAWMIKALNSTENPKYQPLFQEIATQAKDAKVARYAEHVLNR